MHYLWLNNIKKMSFVFFPTFPLKLIRVLRKVVMSDKFLILRKLHPKKFIFGVWHPTLASDKIDTLFLLKNSLMAITAFRNCSQQSVNVMLLGLFTCNIFWETKNKAQLTSLKFDHIRQRKKEFNAKVVRNHELIDR